MRLARKVLKEYLKRTGISITDLAEASSMSQSYLSELVSGAKNNPSWEKAGALEDSTNREVKISYWNVNVEDEGNANR